MIDIKEKIGDIIRLLKKDKLWLFIILIILAIFFKLNKIEMYFGIEIDFSVAFLLLILLNFGLKKALITTAAITIGYIILFNGEYIQVTDILKIAFIGTICKRKLKINTIISEFIFWVVFTIPIIYSIIYFGGVNELEDYYFFRVLFLIVNGILNSFLAEVTSVYIINTRVYKKRVMLKYKEVILHIVTLAILIPFIINIFSDLKNSYDNIVNITESSSDEIYHYILDELDTWNDKSITNLKLSGVIETGLLKESMRKSSRYKPYNIHILDRNNRIIIDIKNYSKEIVSKKDFETYKVTEKLMKAVPINEGRMYFNNNLEDGYFIYNEELGDLDITLMIEIPTEIYNDRIINEYLRQFKFLILFILFIAVISAILNRVIFNSLSKLSVSTKNLPEKLEDDIFIKWPESNIEEINLLTKNIDSMAHTIRENFINLNKTKKKLYELAYYDMLTTLPNRVFFKKYLEEVVDNISGINKVCVMFMDLNRFKIINDTWGHHIGDKLLGEVANRLKVMQNENCNVFRLGGDEFVLVLQFSNYEDIRIIGNEVISKFKKVFKIDDLIINTTCSLGASIYPDHSKDIDTIIKYADISMYASKENGGNYLQLFNEKINEKVIEKILIEEGINKALDKDEFILNYQPKICGMGGKIVSIEALIRWKSKSLGVVPPDKFIPIAEETDLILDIDKWVIFKACKENKRLQDEGYSKIPISVNVSARHFAHIEILDIVEEALEKSSLEPKYLKVEITEGVLIKNVDMVSDIIRKLKVIGVQVSIDDFGKGYSSINQLMTLPINEVKIDRDFIKDISKDIKKKNVVGLIVELAHSLELNVVAEGIETKEEKTYLESIGCDELQGFLFSKPIDIDELKQIL